MISDYFLMSVKNLRRRKLRSWLTMIGIFIGIAAVVSLISLGTGLKTAITGQFGSLSTDKLTIQNSGTGFGPPGSTAVRKLTSHDLDIVKNVDGVEMVISRLIRVVKVEYNKVAQFSYVASMPDDQKQMNEIYSSFDAEIGSGRLLKQGDRKKVVLGKNVAKKEKFGKELTVGKKLVIQGEQFEIIGILKPTSSVINNEALIMPEEDLKEILKIDDEIDLIVAKVKNKDEIEKVAEKIKDKLRRDRDEKEGEEDFSVQTPLQAISSVSTILNIVNVIIAGIAAISLLIGGVGITNTMYTSVLERTREIGTMKAIGAKNSDVLWIFLFEAGLLGLVGGTIGIGLGLGLAFLAASGANSFFGTQIIKVSVSFTLLIGAFGFSFVIGVLAGVLPAIQASKLNPVDALRK